MAAKRKTVRRSTVRARAKKPMVRRSAKVTAKAKPKRKAHKFVVSRLRPEDFKTDGLRSYAQIDPKNEYKKEGYNLFLNMMANTSSNVLAKLFEVKVQRSDDIAAMEAAAEARHHHELEAAVARHPGEEDETTVDPQAALNRMREEAQGAALPPPSAAPKIGRNDPCPCGSGKKFKKCHGAALEDEPDGEDQPTV